MSPSYEPGPIPIINYYSITIESDEEVTHFLVYPIIGDYENNDFEYGSPDPVPANYRGVPTRSGTEEWTGIGVYSATKMLTQGDYYHIVPAYLSNGQYVPVDDPVDFQASDWVYGGYRLYGGDFEAGLYEFE